MQHLEVSGAVRHIYIYMSFGSFGFQLQDRTSFYNVTLPYRDTGEYGMGVLNERTGLFSLVCVYSHVGVCT